jgi:ribonuclease HI
MAAVSEPVNPGGIAAYGAVILKDGKRIWESSKIFEPKNGQVTSNNLAEYSGILEILLNLKGMGLEKETIIIRGDSKLVICQMFGNERGRHWRIKSGFYVPLAHACKKLLKDFPHAVGQWIPREENGLADELSKAELKRAGVQFRIQPE